MSSALLKKLAGTAGLLILLWLVYLYRQVPHSRRPFDQTETHVARVKLSRGSERADLQKQGNSWKVSSGVGPVYPADGQLIQTLLSGLKDVAIEDEISDRPDRAADYEVNAASGTLIEVFGEKDVPLAEGIFGKQAPDFAHIYFRYPEKPNVYLARGVLRAELGGASANFWRDHHLVDIPETKIQGITMEGKGFKTELVRVSTDVWTLGGKRIETGPVDALVGTLAHLRFNEFVDPVLYPAVTYESLTAASVVVKSSDTTIELRIGAENLKSKQFPVSIQKDAGLAWLPESLIHSLQQRPTAFKSKER